MIPTLSKKITILLIIILFSQDVLKATQPTGDPDDFIQSQYDSVRNYYRTDYQQALSILDEIQAYALRKDDLLAYFIALKWSVQCAMDHHQLELFHQYLLDADAALIRFADALGEEKKQHEVDFNGLWASYYFKIASYNKSVSTNYKIIDYLTGKKELTPRDQQLIARSYQYLGTIEKLRGKPEEAISHFWTSLDYIEDFWEDYEKMGRIAYTYQQIGNCYAQMGDDRNTKIFTEKALQSLKKVYETESEDLGARLRLKKNLITTYNSVAAYHLRIGESERALEYLRESLSHHVPDDTYFKATYNLLGEAYASIDDFATALQYYQMALEEKIRDYGPKNYSNGLTILAMGRLMAKQEKHKEAIKYFDRALDNLTNQPLNSIVTKQVNWNAIYAERELIEILHEKAVSAFELFQYHQDRSWLQQAWESSRMAIAIMEEMRSSYQSRKDEQFLLDKCYPLFETTIMAGYHLGPAYYPELFELAEKSKVVLLVDLHLGQIALKQAGIPDSLLEKERLSMAKVNFLEDLIDQEHQKPAMDIEKVRAHYQNLETAKKAYRDLLQNFKETYDYEGPQLGKDQDLLTKIRRDLLKQDQTLLEYFQGDDHLFVFAVDRQHITVKLIPLDFPLAQWIDQFRYGIYGYHLSPEPSAEIFRKTRTQLVDYGHRLYSKLVLPVKKELKRHLIIIPDGQLGYLPFEALLTEPVDPQDRNFNRYPYLLRRYQHSYCYSAMLLNTMKKKRYHTSGLLAFAPTFPKSKMPAPQQIAGLRGQIDTLYHNIEEVDYIRELLGSTTVKIGSEADKETFFRLAPNYKMIHIASHGILNDSISDYSFIAFYGGESKDPAFNLLVKDFDFLRLEAELVTLSACETGLGELKRGEGIISLAWGFAQAGAKSILTTLWSVNDESTTQIMGGFYQNLHQNQSKHVAIHNAKLDYIDSQSDPFEAHPFYWASFIPIGDMAPLETGEKSVNIYFWGALFSILSMLLLALRAGRRRSSLGQFPPEAV